MERTARIGREGLIYSDFVWTHRSPRNMYDASVGERDFFRLMERPPSLSVSMHERDVLTRRIEQLMHKPKRLLGEHFLSNLRVHRS